MKIYFAGSIRGGRADAALYAHLIAHLHRYGTVLTEHVGDAALHPLGEPGLDDRGIHDRDLDWLLHADAIVAEVTTPSLGVGYELGRAVAAQKPVLALYRRQPDRALSAMIGGCPEVVVAVYDALPAGCAAIDGFMQSLSANSQ